MKIDAKQLIEALEAIEVSKGISRETVLAALEDAMCRAYRKELGGDDADVRVNIDLEHGSIDMFHVLSVVKEVEDDFLEISEEDANKQDGSKKYLAGDEFFIPAPVATLKNATLMSIKSIMKQKFAEVERGILYEAFKDKIGTMITGRVETMDEKGASVNIGRTSVFLPRKEMIGDEKFLNGDNIKLFVNDVASGTKGAHIQVSRANEGFLKALFFEEIGDIYNGNIEIIRIARQANERSKVAVFANDPNIDPAGACIGPNGSRIQKIVGQLGNGVTKEKVDVICYYENPILFIVEALKPARIAGLVVNEEDKSSTVVVKDDSLSLAIGKKGVNVRLAAKLTGYKIDIKTETDALNEGFEFTSIDDVNSMLVAYKATRISEAQKASIVSSNEILPGLPEGYVAPQARVYEEEKSDMDEVLLEQSESEDIEISVEPVKEETVKENEPTVEVTTVKTTTSLSDLERSLEAESSKANRKESKKSYKKPKVEETKEEKKVTTTVDPKNQMSIYTEEELKQQALEDAELANEDAYEEDDIDYDEYDDYYDDEK